VINIHSPINCRSAFVRYLVQTIEEDPYQPAYQNKKIGNKVYGWRDRLNAYFWPSPQVDFARTTESVSRLVSTGSELARTIDDWSPDHCRQAVEWANAVLKWGGVPQKRVTADIVHAVIRAAITRDPLGAPMNSGWTKIAAFATAHLEGEGRANAIWDSRVSWSIVRRADVLLHASGLHDIPPWLAGIGRIPGRGGSRWKCALDLRWPLAYGRWASHFAAADLIRDIRDALNQGAAPRAQRSTVWTIRCVEMVLFMDGY
jgi:hypothetical protein